MFVRYFQSYNFSFRHKFSCKYGFSILLLLMMPLFAGAQTLKLSTFQKSPSQQLSTLILIESYKLLDIDLKVFHIPGSKALRYAQAGSVDGEVSRIVGVDQQFPNLIRVPEAVSYLEAAVFTKEVDIEVNDWDSLQPYVIGVPFGATFVTEHTKNLKQVLVPSDIHLLTMLALDELELVVNPLIDGLGRIRQQQLFHVRLLHESLSREYLYHYLHKKHEALVPKIADAIHSLKESGRLEEIRQEFVAQLR